MTIVVEREKLHGPHSGVCRVVSIVLSTAFIFIVGLEWSIKHVGARKGNSLAKSGIDRVSRYICLSNDESPNIVPVSTETYLGTVSKQIELDYRAISGP